jgi:hypothetical protein
MIFLEKVMYRLNEWMNNGEQLYRYELKENQIFIYDYLNSEHIATVEKNLSYLILKKIEIINNEHDLNEWIFLQATNANLIRILSTI